MGDFLVGKFEFWFFDGRRFENCNFWKTTAAVFCRLPGKNKTWNHKLHVVARVLWKNQADWSTFAQVSRLSFFFRDRFFAVVRHFLSCALLLSSYCISDDDIHKERSFPDILSRGRPIFIANNSTCDVLSAADVDFFFFNIFFSSTFSNSRLFTWSSGKTLRQLFVQSASACASVRERVGAAWSDLAGCQHKIWPVHYKTLVKAKITATSQTAENSAKRVSA